VITLLCLSLPRAEAQPTPDPTTSGGATADSAARLTLRLIARATADSVVLRWGLPTYTAWKDATRAGFMIERTEIRRDGDRTEASWQSLTTSPLRPYSMEEWKARFAPEDSLAGAAVQTLHGQSVVSTDDPFGSIVELHMQQRNLVGFALLLADMRADLATGLGLRFVDRTVTPGKGYLYRISTAATIDGTPIDTALTLVITRAPEPLPSVRTLRAEEGEKKVVLQWDRFEHPDRTWSGYFIEQSTDGGRNFSRRGDLPFTAVTKEDEEERDVLEYPITVSANYQPVVYRIRAMDAFGELSPPGNVVTAMGRDKTAPKQPAILPHEIVDETSVRISWELRDDPDPDLEGYMVAKSMSPEGPFDIISDLLPRQTRSWIDVDVHTLPAHYYVVAAVDTAGNSRMSAPVLALFPDSIPPAMPTGLRAQVDTLGVMQLAWTANTEPDLQGYRVFYANDPSHEFQQLTTAITVDTVYADTLTLKTLSELAYFKVVALDHNFNHSPFSEMLTVEKPDIVPPSAPLIQSIDVTDDAVEIRWHPSPTSDAAAHVLLRRPDGKGDWQRLDSTADKTIRWYRDADVDPGASYEYALYAWDDDGLRSPLSNIVRAVRGGRMHHDGVAAISGGYHAERGAVRIEWTWEGGDCAFHLYRGTDAGPVRLYRSISSDLRSIEDVPAPGTWKYAVKVVHPDGGESALQYTSAIVVP
jgi:fibronectin type 3 domain-containing protein